MDEHQKRIEAAYLVRCSAQAAYDWLNERKHPEGEKPYSFENTPAVLEYLLARRNDPLIDLGVARFGKSTTAIKRVFDRGNLGVRCAALSNPVVGPEGSFRTAWLDKKTLQELTRRGSNAELQALATNPFLDDEAIEHLLEKQEEFAELSEIQYIQMLVWLGKNPRLAQPYDDAILDGWAQYSHGKVFDLAWELARTMDANKTNATVLYELLRRVQHPVGYENPEEVMARWRIEEELEEGDHPIAGSFFLRSLLADLMAANDDLLNSDDLALRQSFYKRFSVWEYKDWPKFIEKDGAHAFDAIVENDGLWQSADKREKLRELAWEVPDPHSSMMAPNTRNWVEERKRREHPEWFRDEDEEYSNEPDAVIRRLDKKINKLANSMDVDFDGYGGDPTVKRIEDKFENFGDKIDRLESALDHMEDTDSGIFETVSNGLHELKGSLNELKESLNEVRSDIYASRSNPEAVRVVPTWVWIAAAVFVIVFLIK